MSLLDNSPALQKRLHRPQSRFVLAAHRNGINNEDHDPQPPARQPTQIGAHTMPAYRFGKHPPQHDYRTLRLKKYLMSALAPPPPAYDVLPNVYAKLKTSDPAVLFPMDANDSLSDCTIAALAHAVTTY